ncbi:hypothetical protein NDU88_002755 [Pleurodeles waltl]|uniref:Uncharacterized protein n=1 Tax=Pleurodeles waltl TaxID=8319 RepID=A0AAV7SDL6_PLEWA|nr:hypothetical protein NDU88_002755 [Pleurodeles waltl]
MCEPSWDAAHLDEEVSETHFLACRDRGKGPDVSGVKGEVAFETAQDAGCGHRRRGLARPKAGTVLYPTAS